MAPSEVEKPALSKSATFAFSLHPSISSFAEPPHAYLASHPKADFESICTGAIVFDDAGGPGVPRILLVQRALTDTLPGLWEVPGGACDAGEAVVQAAARELLEEAGLTATRVGPVVGAPQVLPLRSGRLVGKFNFLVDVQRQADGGLDVVLHPDEHQSFVWATEAEVGQRLVGDVRLAFTSPEMEAVAKKAFQVRREGM